MADEQPQSKPLVERANVWVSVFTAVAALVVSATQQRPASSVAFAIGVVALLIGAAVFLLTAREDGKRRFSRAVRLATVTTAVILVAGAITAFAVPASRDALVHDVLGFPSPTKEIKIADVEIRPNDTAYAIEVTALNKLRTEEFVDEVELRVEAPCAPDASPASYRIDSEFRTGATDQNGSRLQGKAFREGDNGQFYSVVRGSMTRCAGGAVSLTARLGVGTVLPPGQHSKITVEVPRTLEVEDTRPVPTPLQPGAAPPSQSPKTRVAVHMPVAGLSSGRSERLHVTLTVGERRAKITHTTTG